MCVRRGVLSTTLARTSPFHPLAKPPYPSRFRRAAEASQDVHRTSNVCVLPRFLNSNRPSHKHQSTKNVTMLKNVVETRKSAKVSPSPKPPNPRTAHFRTAQPRKDLFWVRSPPPVDLPRRNAPGGPVHAHHTSLGLFRPKGSEHLNTGFDQTRFGESRSQVKKHCMLM